MKRIVSMILTVVLLFSLGACAPSGSTGSTENGGGMNAETIATQMAGVAKALETLPTIPADEETQKQIDGYAAWAAFLLKTAAPVVAAVAAGG